MSDEAPLVSVIIPALDEEADIAGCLDAVLSQTHPHHRLEVVVVDGGSSDRTAEVAKEALSGSDLVRWEVVDNPGGNTPSNLNVGLGWAEGDQVCRVDARSLIPADYVERCSAMLETWPDVAVVGGAQVAQALPGAGTVAAGIARALRNPYATGFARYRRRTSSGSTDTVYLGFFRRSDLEAVGGWNEGFGTNQDFELNRRMGSRGTVWYLAGLEVGYLPRPTLGALLHQHLRFGRWKAAAWLEGGVPMSRRQKVLLAAPPLAASLVTWSGVRRPRTTITLLVAALAALDRASGEQAPMDERAVAMIATLLMAGGWWTGVVQHTVAHAAGQRLLQTGDATTR